MEGTLWVRIQRATIYDVARVAGVASSTVSRAFSRPSRINAQTVQRVREVAASLGYSPNQTARGLSTGRTGNLAMVVPNIGNPFFTQFMRSFHEVAAQRGFAVHLIDTDENAAEEIRRIEGALSQVDGFALVSPRMGQSELRDVAGRGRFVLINRKVEEFPCIWVDSRPALREALRDLAELGHRIRRISTRAGWRVQRHDPPLDRPATRPIGADEAHVHERAAR